jgi:hypothetical protein
MKNGILALLCLFVAVPALAFDLGVSGFSRVQKLPNGQKVYHYSNISSKTALVDGEVRFVSAQGGVCDKDLNDGCKQPSDLVTMGLSNLLMDYGLVHMVVSPTTLSTGTALTGYSIMSFSLNNGITLKNTFGNICKAAAQKGVSVDEKCESTTPGKVAKFFVTVVADYNNNSVLDIEDQWVSIPVVVNSSIETESCACDGSGLYRYDLEAQGKGIALKNILTEENFPHLNEVGLKSVRFYYVTGPETYSAESFANIDMKSKYFEIPINQTTGELATYTITKGVEKGVRYYLRVALVDNSGNIGYMADSIDAPLTHSVYIPR